MRATSRTEQQAVALAVVARALGPGRNLHQTPVAVLTVPGGDTLRYDGTAGVAAEVNHLRAGVRLLVIVRNRHGVEFPDGIVAGEDTAGIFPGDGRAGFDLRPRNLAPFAFTQAALGYKIVDTALALFVAGIPVLDGGIIGAVQPSR